VLAAPAVRATVVEALRAWKTACHRHHFTAILHPVKVRLSEGKTRRSAVRSLQRFCYIDKIPESGMAGKECVCRRKPHSGQKTHLIQ
jgi:hypothetical protein